MTTTAWWLALGIVGAVLMAAFVWFLINTVIPLLFNLLLGASILLVALGFAMLAMQDAKGSSGRRSRRSSKRR